MWKTCITDSDFVYGFINHVKLNQIIKLQKLISSIVQLQLYELSGEMWVDTAELLLDAGICS